MNLTLTEEIVNLVIKFVALALVTWLGNKLNSYLKDNKYDKLVEEGVHKVEEEAYRRFKTGNQMPSDEKLKEAVNTIVALIDENHLPEKSFSWIKDKIAVVLGKKRASTAVLSAASTVVVPDAPVVVVASTSPSEVDEAKKSE